ncbi:galactokinase [Nilaparvata lugens]|uniref:galactokinase n=1 Tax=Nilaparvata lugens TaxID=108931 RepID=UPI00193E19D0|nr:galactokinase [Nilaparvata lugens]XP_039283613.1 galactokinase [Nilaparvata lugens]XP_039283614.1 galactokinase [Nilaparvata lugens]
MDPDTPEILLEEAKKAFKDTFKADAEVAVCAPGRVNLIGEHTDYNDGYVLPMALPLVTIAVGRKNGRNDIQIKTLAENVDQPTMTSFPVPSVTEPLVKGDLKWANYVKGVIANFKGEVPGFDAMFISSVPVGGGLSSSASLEVATYTLLEALTATATNHSSTEKALACQKAEHDFAGVPCGIMDQTIVTVGRESHAVLIDCRTNGLMWVPITDHNLVFVITNSNVRHELSSGEYAVRRDQCERAAALLKIPSLRDGTLGHLENLKVRDGIEDVLYRRARHVIGEIARTYQAATILKDSNDAKTFGQLMFLSHQSLKDDYEVSCSELDQLVEIARSVDGVLGSRMTGGGFGGCTVTLVTKGAVNDLIEKIKTNYNGNPTFYIAKPSQGARILQL